MTESPMLEVEDLRVGFVQYERGLRRRTVEVLTGMDLSVGAGEVVAVVGASGAGKSLLAHAVLGLLPANAVEQGVVRIRGEAVDPEARRRLAGRGVGLLPQSLSHLDPTASVGAQVRRAARLAGSADPRRDARLALAARGLGAEVERRRPHELSGGMARRVLTAMALLGRPELLVADEPTPGLPEDQVRDTLAELRAVADDGAGVVLITHDLRAGLVVADRVVVCVAGRTVDVVEPDSFTGGGELLEHPWTRAMWRALPGNGFLVEGALSAAR